MGIIDKSMTDGFRHLGHLVAAYPRRFILSSIIIALTLGTGILQFKYDDDVQRLYSTSNGRSTQERKQLDIYFPANYSGAFSPSRITQIGRLARIIIETKDGRNVFQSDVWREIEELDRLVHSISISHEGQAYNYSGLCAQPTPNVCWENEFLDLGQVMGQIENGSLRLSYPVMINPVTYQAYGLPLHFSAVNLSDDSVSLRSAAALALTYFLRFETPEEDYRGRLWEEAVTKAVLAAAPHWTYINVYHLTYYSFVSEQEKNTYGVMPYFSITLVIMIGFILATAMSRDWVKAKPVVALFGMIAACLGSLSGFGVLSYMGVVCIGINLTVPFIMIGIGIDDTFVMLSAWRQTNPVDPVPKRLGDTYAEAGVSITITSLTDMFSFFVGLLTPIPSVQIFCAYAGTCVLAIYLFQIFFFGAILGISGEQEAGHRHPMFWWIHTVPKSNSDEKPSIFKIFFPVISDRTPPNTSGADYGNGTMLFFRDVFAPFLCKKWTRVFVLIAFVFYLGVAIWGLFGLEEGLREERLFQDDSYMTKFLTKEQQLFRRYVFRIQVGITTPLDYSKPEVRDRVNNLLIAITNSSKYVSPDYGENWLNGFTNYVDRYSEIFEFNITTEQQFIDVLKEHYLPNNIFTEDIRFNPNGTQILGSRFILQLRDTISQEDCKEAMIAFRAVADANPDLGVLVYNPWMSFVDQFILIRPLTIQLLSTASAIVMIVAIIFIPNLITAICVFFTIASTEVGVIGLMCLWGVSLDMISIICLIMCIGFSVDFSAHISYAYICGSGSPEERIGRAMYSLGLPILQGGGSTIIGVISLVFISSYIFQVFFKVVFLVIVCAAWHGLFVLPVLLLLIKPERFSGNCFKKHTGSMEISNNPNKPIAILTHSPN